jgi:Holliday junction resolvase RusA-like endonuclease
MLAEKQGRKPAEPSRPLLAAFRSISALPSTVPLEGAYVRIPWSHLVSDNAKLRAALDKKGRPTVVLTPDYREAKKRIGELCAEAMDGRPALTVPLRLVAQVWVPNNHRRDVVNFSKALHDAMAGTIFEDDSQLHDVRWIRAGVDVDAPRCELTITPL